jgi:hypothetical protein
LAGSETVSADMREVVRSKSHGFISPLDKDRRNLQDSSTSNSPRLILSPVGQKNSREESS